MSASATDPRWIFDAAPPSGARRGGDPAEYAFNRTLDTFVREALQNANDQSLEGGDARAEVRFEVEALRGQALRDFRAALGWEQLAAHARGVAAVGSSKFSGASLAGDSLLLLKVEDRRTSGLLGEEDEDGTNFRALCRDSLFSHKGASAGGSYGLGKSVYWSFSALSTVVFHSCLAGSGRPRLIGRAELPSHRVQGEDYSGPGWFGAPRKVQRGERAESVWDEQALDLARSLRVARPPKVTGTTILVVGFRDPTGEGPEDVDSLLAEIRASARRFFWPAMGFPRPLQIFVGGEPVTPSEEVAPFAAAWAGRASAGATLARPGDLARRTLTLELPRRRDAKERAAHEVRCELVVRLAALHERRERYDNHVALFRGPGMVVKYLPGDPAGVLPRFHALLACGEAREPGAPGEDDGRAEHFLRASEPPGHDEWQQTPRLKEEYVQGGGAGLQRLFAAVRGALRELLLPASADEARGPALLQRRYPLGGAGDSASPGGGAAFHFSGVEARFSAGRWRFSGRVEPATRGRAWRATIALKMLGDGGGEVDRLEIDELVLREGRRGRLERHEDGTWSLSAGAGVDGLAFEGISAAPPGRERLCEIALEIEGELKEGE